MSDSPDQRVREILSLVLEIPIGPGDRVSRETEPRWDSLHHVEVVFTLEDEFGVSFDEEELTGLTRVDALSEAITRHLAP
jgi:acyl carrier protein